MFFDRFKQICMEKGVKPSNVVEAIGMNRSAVTYWKNNDILPKAQVVKKLADQLGVSVERLMVDPDEEINMLIRLPRAECYVYLENMAQQAGIGLPDSDEVKKLADNRDVSEQRIRDIYEYIKQKKTDDNSSVSENAKYIQMVLNQLTPEKEAQVARILKALFPDL